MAKSNHLMALLSVWGILLVVLGHSGFEESLIVEKLSYLHSWIYSFHMPLFFLISGFLFSLTNPVLENACTKKFIWKKTQRLIVPYVVLGIVYFTIKYTFSGLSHADRVFSVPNFFKMFIIPGAEYSTIGHLWYVFTLYMVFIVVLGLISIRLLSVNRLKIGLLMIVLWTLKYLFPSIKLFNFSGLLWYMPFFLGGILLQRDFDCVKRVFTIANGGEYKMLIYFTLTIVFLFIPIHGLVFRIIRAITGLFFSLSLCDYVIRHYPILKDLMVKFSNKTYTIYLLSWFGQYIVKFVLVNKLNLHFSIVVAGMFAGGIIFPLVACWLVDKVPFLNNKGIRLIIGY